MVRPYRFLAIVILASIGLPRADAQPGDLLRADAKLEKVAGDCKFTGR